LFAKTLALLNFFATIFAVTNLRGDFYGSNLIKLSFLRKSFVIVRYVRLGDCKLSCRLKELSNLY